MIAQTKIHQVFVGEVSAALDRIAGAPESYPPWPRTRDASPMIRKATIHRFPYVMFSREYSRFFGNAPIKDIARLRDEGFARRDGDR